MTPPTDSSGGLAISHLLRLDLNSVKRVGLTHAARILGLSLLLLSACSASEPIPTESVLVTWDLDYETDGPPIFLQVDPLTLSDAGWAQHEVRIFGGQSEYIVELEASHTLYHAEGSRLIGVEPNPNPSTELARGDSLSLTVVLIDELQPGESFFTLALPLRIRPLGGEPMSDGEVVIEFGYSVQSPELRTVLQPFCDEVVPLLDGRTPSIEDLNRVDELAERHLDNASYSQLMESLDQLIADLRDFQDGRGSRYSTVELNSLVGSHCNILLRSEEAER